MTKPSRSSVMGTRVSVDVRTRFAALAARHQLSESGLLARVVDEVLRVNASAASGSVLPRGVHASGTGCLAEERVTLRLREGDRARVSERAEARGMKSGSYLTMLIHNHVRGSAVLPPRELDQLRVSCGQLAALGRQLRMFGMPNTAAEPWASDLRDAIALARREIEAVREATATVVQRNLISWETNSREADHA